MRRLVLASLAAGSIAVAAACTPVKPGTPQPRVIQVPFEFTGASQTWPVPDGVTAVAITAVGAAGGHGFGSATVDNTISGTGGTGGLGGAVSGTVAVTPGQTLQVNVGGRGQDGSSSGVAAGGFNGGEHGIADTESCTGVSATAAGGGGGGASDVRSGAFALANRLVVAGGGGGGGSPYAFAHVPSTEHVTDGGAGGDGGGAAGSGGSGSFPGGGATESAGGSAGSLSATAGVLGGGGTPTLTGGCLDNDHSVLRAGGGGGGGNYGGGGGGAPTIIGDPPPDLPGGGGGGGGSGFGPTGSQFLTGVREGNGQVTLTYVAAS